MYKCDIRSTKIKLIVGKVGFHVDIEILGKWELNFPYLNIRKIGKVFQNI